MAIFDAQDAQGDTLTGREAAAYPTWAPADSDTRDVTPIEALDCLAHGIVITDCRSRPLLVNRMARAIIAADDGLRLDAGGLAAARAAETVEIRWMITLASNASNVGAAGRVMSISRPSPRRPLTVAVAPTRSPRRGLAEGQPAAIVFINDPERTAPIPAAFLQQAYGLTPAEAAVAIEIARGDGLQTVGERLGIRRSTVRTHLQRAFEKTGTRRQAKLAWLIAESCAGLRLDSACSAEQMDKPMAGTVC
jgi:DNA-binding CsgD family transcriptional regulator